MKSQKEGHKDTCILQLPNHILQQIFPRIPIKNLVECMFVCKIWSRLILDPQLTEQYFSRTACVLLSSHEVHFLATATLGNASSSPNDVALRLSKDSVVLTTSDVDIVDSCNGLLFLYEYKYTKKMRCRFYISNTPPGGEISHLPYGLLQFRFGGSNGDPGTEVLVLTVGYGGIRNFRCRLDHQLYAICVGGFLHWIDLSRAQYGPLILKLRFSKSYP